MPCADPLLVDLGPEGIVGGILKKILHQSAAWWLPPLVWSSIITCVSIDPVKDQEKHDQIRQTQAPEHEKLLMSLAAKFPPERFVATWASGPTVIEAVNQARVEIASRINSEITATSRSRRSLKSASGVADHSMSVLTVDVSSTSTFKHGE